MNVATKGEMSGKTTNTECLAQPFKIREILWGNWGKESKSTS